MRINKKGRVIAVGTLSVALLAGAAAVSATAAVQANGSDGPVYVYNGNDGTPLDTAGYSYAWDESVVAGADPVDPMVGELACPAGSTGAYRFMTEPGTERTGTDGWKAYSPDVITATGGVFLPNITPDQMVNGQGALIKSTGGTYDLGVACTIDNGVNVVAAYYRTATVTAGTGVYTLAVVDAGTVVVPPAPAGTSGDITMSAATTGAVNGTLGLTVPAGAAATFGTPTLVGNKSTTTGTLPTVTVVDDRVVTQEGWTLGATVAPFVNAANPADTIAASQLTVAPAIVAASTTSVGAVAGASFTGLDVAGSSLVAQASAGQGTGNTVLGGDLTFVAPQNKAAGTYNSTMTVTVVSQ